MFFKVQFGEEVTTLPPNPPTPTSSPSFTPPPTPKPHSSKAVWWQHDLCRVLVRTGIRLQLLRSTRRHDHSSAMVVVHKCSKQEEAREEPAWSAEAMNACWTAKLNRPEVTGAIEKAFVETKKTADVINDFFTKTMTGVASPREQQVSAASRCCVCWDCQGTASCGTRTPEKNKKPNLVGASVSCVPWAHGCLGRMTKRGERFLCNQDASGAQKRRQGPLL